MNRYRLGLVPIGVVLLWTFAPLLPLILAAVAGIVFISLVARLVIPD